MKTYYLIIGVGFTRVKVTEEMFNNVLNQLSDRFRISTTDFDDYSTCYFVHSYLGEAFNFGEIVYKE